MSDWAIIIWEGFKEMSADVSDAEFTCGVELFLISHVTEHLVGGVEEDLSGDVIVVSPRRAKVLFICFDCCLSEICSGQRSWIGS